MAGFWTGGYPAADPVDAVGTALGLAAERLLCQAARLRTTRFEQVRGAEQQPRDIDAGDIGPAKIDVAPFKALRRR